jgi:excisionase family DNA binding protein
MGYEKRFDIWKHIPKKVEKRVYTIEEIMQILGVSRGTAYEYAHSGYFQIVKVGNQIRIKKNSFDNWFEERERYKNERRKSNETKTD